MKIRIQGNSVRLRLTKTEVDNLCSAGYLEEQTYFGNNTFVYALQSTDNANELSADFEDSKITLYIPASFIKDWAINDIVGMDAQSQVADNQLLYLLVEKDFQCLDETTEDQSDNYENPNKACGNE